MNRSIASAGLRCQPRSNSRRRRNTVRLPCSSSGRMHSNLAFACPTTTSLWSIDICRRLDGIPLAIELAAARVPLLGVQGLHDRLDQMFNVLSGGTRMKLRRHQTLRAALEWSYGLLSADEQAVFQRLGVFAGGFTLELAQQLICDDRVDWWSALGPPRPPDRQVDGDCRRWVRATLSPARNHTGVRPRAAGGGRRICRDAAASCRGDTVT